MFKELKDINYLITTFFGAGLFPKMPGTFASIIAFIPLLFFGHYGRILFLISGIITILAISIPMIKKVENKYGSDASIIVIDEVLGVWIVFLSPMIPITWLGFLLGIGIFRIFDIKKPGIIGKINNKKGTKYVLIDDILAAIFTSAILHIFFILYRIFFSVYYLNNILG